MKKNWCTSTFTYASLPSCFSPNSSDSSFNTKLFFCSFESPSSVVKGASFCCRCAEEEVDVRLVLIMDIKIALVDPPQFWRLMLCTFDVGRTLLKASAPRGSNWLYDKLSWVSTWFVDMSCATESKPGSPNWLLEMSRTRHEVFMDKALQRFTIASSPSCWFEKFAEVTAGSFACSFVISFISAAEDPVCAVSCVAWKDGHFEGWCCVEVRNVFIFFVSIVDRPWPFYFTRLHTLTGTVPGTRLNNSLMKYCVYVPGQVCSVLQY